MKSIFLCVLLALFVSPLTAGDLPWPRWRGPDDSGSVSGGEYPANLLDEKVGDYKINSTFETATGTTNVEIRKSKTPLFIFGVAIIVLLAFVLFLLIRT